MKRTVKSADCGVAKAFGLTGEGTESGVDVGVRQREHVELWDGGGGLLLVTYRYIYIYSEGGMGLWCLRCR